MFVFGALNAGSVTQMTIVMLPLATGFQTNFFSASSSSATNIVVTNAITTVIGEQTNLSVTLTGFPQNIFINDRVTYRIVVTNSSASSIQSVVATNILPAGVKFIGSSPANQAPFTNNILIYHLGALAADSFTNVQVTVQPTNSGVLTFSAFVSAGGLFDASSASETVSSDITVEDFIGTLIATNFSVMQLDPQTGLEYQTIRLSNIGSNAVPSARVIVSGLTNRLYNAVGTNNGNPFVVYGNTLDTNQSVNLILEYFTPTRVAFTVSNSQYMAVGIDSTNFSAPVGTNGTFEVKNPPHVFTNGAVLIEFASTPGRVYTIYYSDDMVTWLAAQPSITAQANRTQWIDDGPPKTISFPSGRFYKVFLNP